MDMHAHLAGVEQQRHFWFKSRLELVNILLNKAKTQPNIKILNVGCGIGDDLETIAKYGQVHVLDIDQTTLDLVPKALVKEKCCADICKIPYKDNYFDLVIAFDILEHVEDDHKAVAEIKRVLKSNGKIIFTVPAVKSLYSAHDKMEFHFRRYSKNMAENLFSGFSKQTSGHWLSLLFLPAAIQRISSKKSPKVDHFQKFLPQFVHNILYGITHFENWCIKKGLRFPIGLTLYGIYKK